MKLYQTVSKCFLAVTKLFLLTVILTATIQAQSSRVDLSFNALPSDYFGIDSIVTGFYGNFVLQRDGKILAFGSFQIVNGVIKNVC